MSKILKYSLLIFSLAFGGCDFISELIGSFSGSKFKPIEGDIIFEIREGYTEYNAVEEPKVMICNEDEKDLSVYELVNCI